MFCFVLFCSVLFCFLSNFLVRYFLHLCLCILSFVGRVDWLYFFTFSISNFIFLYFFYMATLISYVTITQEKNRQTDASNSWCFNISNSRKIFILWNKFFGNNFVKKKCMVDFLLKIQYDNSKISFLNFFIFRLSCSVQIFVRKHF